VENPKKITIAKAPAKQAMLPLHPDFSNRGCRIIETGTDFYVQDTLEPKKAYRFMHLFNFKDLTFVSEHVDEKLKAKMIHWLPVSKDLIAVEIFMPDGTWKKGLAEATLRTVGEGTLVQFERFGFCKCDQKIKEKMIFWFTH
jgi:glutamyl-tRNA synthetase